MVNQYLKYIVVLVSLIAYESFAQSSIFAIAKPTASQRSAGSSIEIESRALPPFLGNGPSRIVGGNATTRAKYPEFATLWVDGLDGFYYAICGASLIANNKILTAAHCVVDLSTSRLFIVPNFYSFNDSLVASDFIPVSAKSVHNGYNASTSNNDIAVLTLAQNVSSAKAKVFGGLDQLVNQTATVIGIGLTFEGSNSLATTLREVSVSIVTQQFPPN